MSGHWPITRALGLKVNPRVFWISFWIIMGFVAVSLTNVDAMGASFTTALGFIADRFGWFYILSVSVFLGFVVTLLFSRHGDIRLGGPGARPEFSTWSWFAMLFSAGMGIGLLFYGVAEPMYHYASPPIGEANTLEAARTAMTVTFFHWGLHAWGIYALVGLALAYFSFNKGQPLTIRSALRPVLGKYTDGALGDAVDIFATVATLFGLATSLGLGVQQINAGLHHLFGLTQSVGMQVLLIIVITGAATVSVVLGVDKGIRRLSEINIWFALSLLAFVLILGPTTHLLDAFVQNTGAYIQQLPAMSLWTEAYRGTNWQNSWTVFYWAWWIAWSPFVGMFIARISKGRTIREFLLGVLFVPTALTFLWLTVFGNTALYLERHGGGIADAVNADVAVALFVMLEKLPWAGLTCAVGIIVVATFFVTSSDSASLVVDIITAGGDPNPPTRQRVFWAVTEGGVAAVLLYAGGLKALQTAVIITGLPFTIILLAMAVSLVKGLNQDSRSTTAAKAR